MAVAGTAADKRKIRGQESRSQILLSAVDRIAALGLGKLTLDRVAEHAGISRGLVVFHFKSKDRLIEEVLQFLTDEYDREWSAVVGQPGGDSLDKLLRLVDFDINYCFDNPLYIAAWHAFWGEARGNSMFKRVGLPTESKQLSELDTVLADMIREGGHSDEDMKMVSASLAVMLYGIWIDSHIDPRPFYRDIYRRSVRHYLSHVFPGHAVPLDLDKS